MAASKTTIFIVFVLCLSCTLVVNISGIQATAPSSTSKESLTAEIELTNGERCKTDNDCPQSHPCPKEFYYACLLGECTCIAI
ncbi:unnamed protein product [Arabidopsis arenosa]|uniref:Uncharacterized protein n=3 Tax=Arabidopsis TaxID=3701 RepID=A0A8T2AFZ6_ARASU|nr:hypothetical protein ISN45_Aa04g000650 [Arabidopsis thaliana x Arabidopsis arenosa]KAG7571629.1 hypothetical protein ISN44_As09g000640 [Arabidopsis suecica]CAE6000621.1 unnamed protein product [Arabidopsis arenosa]